MDLTANALGHSLVRKLERTASFSANERSAIANLPISRRQVRTREDIVVEGEAPDTCVLVLRGWVGRYKMLAEGRRQLLSIHVPGDIPDLHSLYLTISDHNLCAMTDAVVAAVPHASLKAVTAAHPRIAAGFWRDTLIDVAIAHEWIVGLGRRSAHGRTAHLFCELYSRLEAVGLASNFEFSLPLTQIDLADALGMSIVHVNRTLQDLRHDNLIVLRRGTLTIPDWDALVQASEFNPRYLHIADQQRAEAQTR